MSLSTEDLEEGWTAHKAPTGHTYYYNAATKKSTYKRPGKAAPVSSITPPVQLDAKAEASGEQESLKAAVEQLQATNAFQNTTTTKPKRPRKDNSIDRPKSKFVSEESLPWIKVYTRKGYHFYHNVDTLESLWILSPELRTTMQDIDDAEALAEAESSEGSEIEYEPEEGSVKAPQNTLEFGEDDIDWQLAALEEAGMTMPDYGDLPEQSKAEKDQLFLQMLRDCDVNPYNTWDAEVSKIASDPCYLVLDSTNERKIVFEAYCTERAQELQAIKAATKTQNPRIAFLELAAQALKKPIYFVDFKRKHRKEAAYKGYGTTDHEREKLFRALQDKLKLSLKERQDEHEELMQSAGEKELDVRYYLLEGG